MMQLSIIKNKLKENNEDQYQSEIRSMDFNKTKENIKTSGECCSCCEHP
jgi:hypothetical protein